jgi:hypothetical protein
MKKIRKAIPSILIYLGLTLAISGSQLLAIRCMALLDHPDIIVIEAQQFTNKRVEWEFSSQCVDNGFE